MVVGPGHGGPAAVANAYLEGTWSERYSAVGLGRRRPAHAVPRVLVPGRRRQPRDAGGAGLDPRRRRAGLLARPRLRRGVRQPGSGRVLRRRRRRGGDRSAGRELALEQVPEPGARRRGAADPAPERLQDRQSDRSSRAFPKTELRDLFDGLRLRAAVRHRRRARGRCTASSPPRSTRRSTTIADDPARGALRVRRRRSGRAGR